MEDVNISKFRAQVVRSGSTPASPGFVVSEGQNPVDPSGSGQNHLPVTIATASTGLSITDAQVLGGAGTVGQYIRGDGSLADFPATTGGGSSVSYYLNGSVSQGTIGGVAYKELNRTPIFGAGTDISINANGYIASFITDALDPNKLLIPAGNWNFETYFSANSSGGSPSFYIELYKYNGTTFTLLATSSSSPELIAFGTNLNPYFSTLAVPETVLALTDRLAVRFYVTHSGRTITLHTENGHLCQVITTFTTGLTALNGLTAQVQNFAVGTAGTDFAIASATATHTFNLPTASATNRGALSSADWTTFNNKTSNLGTVTSVGLSSATSGVTIGSTPITTSGTITLAIATASGSQNGLLSSTDWTTFNGKQNALTNPVTGTGTSGTLPKFTGSTTIGNSLFTDNGTHGAFGGANYSGGTDVRSFNISAPLYAGLGFWANNQYAADIFGYGVSGNIIVAADPGNIFTDSRVILSTDGTQRFAVFSNGNVTIANSPTDAGFKLDVNGTGRFSGAVQINSNITGLLLNRNAVTNYTGVGYLTGGVGQWFVGMRENLSSNNYVIYNENGTGDVLTISKSNNSATFSSSVSGTSLRSSAVGTFGFNTINNGEFQIYATASNGMIMAGRGSSTDMVITNKNGSDVFTIPTGTTIANFVGNVGIGTTSPAYPLDIQSSSGALGISLRGRASDDISLITFFNNAANTQLAKFTAASTYFSTDVGGTERMRITSGGNVLIGTTTDNGEKLNVNGTIRTANPTGSTSDGWLLGRALVSGSSTPDRWIRVQIGNLYYDILSRYIGSV